MSVPASASSGKSTARSDELVVRISNTKPVLRDAHDAVAFVVHTLMLEAGWKCVALDEKTDEKDCKGVFALFARLCPLYPACLIHLLAPKPQIWELCLRIGTKVLTHTVSSITANRLPRVVVALLHPLRPLPVPALHPLLRLLHHKCTKQS